MPIIKSAKKRVVQTKKRQARNYNTRTALRKAIRRLTEAVKAGDKATADKELTATYKVIDTAAKKNILPRNTANRRKATMAKMVASVKGTKKAAEPAKAKKAPAKKAAPKKTAAKKTTAKKAE